MVIWRDWIISSMLGCKNNWDLQSLSLSTWSVHPQPPPLWDTSSAYLTYQVGSVEVRELAKMASKDKGKQKEGQTVPSKVSVFKSCCVRSANRGNMDQAGLHS